MEKEASIPLGELGRGLDRRWESLNDSVLPVLIINESHRNSNMYHYQRQKRSETKIIHTCSEGSSECITDLPFCRAGLLLSLRSILFLWNCDLQAGLQAFWRQRSQTLKLLRLGAHSSPLHVGAGPLCDSVSCFPGEG